MLLRALLLGFLFASGAAPQSVSADLPPGVLLVSRIKARVKEQFAHMPQYTCLETLDRFQKPGGKRAVEKQLDTVRIEVLFAGHGEFFDSPGGRDFKEPDPARFITKGMIGNGMFASHLKNIFVDDNGLFEYRGEENLHGRRAARFHFRVPSLQSAYIVSVPGARANVGIVGTFWADPVTYDLIRIEIDGADIPPILQISQIAVAMDYARTRIGPREALLAQTGTLLMVRDSGEVSFDRFDFTHCHAYEAESTISFGEADAAPAAVAPQGRPQLPERILPAGIPVEIELTAPLTDSAAVGELVEGKVIGKVAARGVTLIPDGALVHGRVRQLEKHSELGGYFSIGLEFTDIEAGGASLRFFAELQSLVAIPGLERKLMTNDATAPAPDGESAAIHLLDSPLAAVGSMRTEGEVIRQAAERIEAPDLPGVGFFFMRGAHFALPAGFRMIWKTQKM